MIQVIIVLLSWYIVRDGEMERENYSNALIDDGYTIRSCHHNIQFYLLFIIYYQFTIFYCQLNYYSSDGMV